MAGRVSWFLLSARTPSSRASASSLIQWGTNLPFDVQLMNIDASTYEQPIQATVRDIGNGQYNITYRVTNSSQYQLSIRLDDQDVPSSPLRVTVLPSSVSPAHCRLSGDGVAVVMKDQPVDFSVQLYDVYENEIVGMLPELRWTVVVKTNSDSDEAAMVALPIVVRPSVNGTVIISYTPPSVSQFYLSVYLNDVPITSSPMVVLALDGVGVYHATQVSFWTVCSFCIVIISVFAVIIGKNKRVKIIKAGVRTGDRNKCGCE